MPNLRLINLNVAGGAQVNVFSSIPARYAEFIEDESVTPQGLVYQVPGWFFRYVPGRPRNGADQAAKRYIAGAGPQSTTGITGAEFAGCVQFSSGRHTVESHIGHGSDYQDPSEGTGIA